MKKSNKMPNPSVTACIVAVAAFVTLTFLAGGLVEFSHDAGSLRWVRDLLIYSFANKLWYKLAASLVLGFVAYFVSAMVAYGKTIKAKKRAKATRVHFPPAESGFGRTA